MSGIIFLPAFKHDGTDISPAIPPKNLDMGAGGFKDDYVTVAIPLGEAGATSIATIAPSIIGAINENNGRIDFLEGIGAFTTKTDPALDAISVADIDDFVGCSILLTAAGNDQNLPNPTDTAVWHHYIVINDDTSTDPIDIIGASTRTLAPSEFAKFIWDGTAWISIAGGTIIWIDDGTDIKTAISTRNIDLQNGGLKDNDVSTAIALGEAGETSFDTTKKSITGAVNEVNANIPQAQEDLFTPTLSQTVFALSSAPSGAAAFALYLNGQLREVGTDYTQAGTVLTWLDPGGLTLLTTDLLTARYNDAGATPIWSDDGTDLTPNSAGRNVDIGTGVLKDNDATAGLPLAESGDVALHAAFSAASIIGALNENKTKETFISKAFGDSPYSAVAGNNAIAVDTSGGAVSIVLPSAAANQGVRIRISKVTSDADLVTINTTGGDTVGFQGSWALSHQGDSVTAISDGGTEWCLFTERHASDSRFFSIEPDSNLGNHRVQSIAGSGSWRFEFQIPANFLSIIKLALIASPSAGAAGSGKDIDLASDYATIGEAYNNHTEVDTSTVYDFTGETNNLIEIDISPVFSSIGSLDMCGIFVDHNGIGGSINYFGIQLDYIKKS